MFSKITSFTASALLAIVASLPPAMLPDEIGAQWHGGGAISSTAGRLFFDADEGGDAPTPSSCSANVVESENRSVIMTAAHCAWGTNYRFIPGYDDGAAPYGEWEVKEVFHPNTPSLAEDFAVMVLEPLQGQRIEDVVGAQRIDFESEAPDRVGIFGYPRERANDPEHPYGGKHLTYSAGQTLTGPFGRIGTASDMSRGVSGGPLLKDFDSTTGIGTQVGAVSGSPCMEFDEDGECTEIAVETYGVLFTEVTQQLFEQAEATTL